MCVRKKEIKYCAEGVWKPSFHTNILIDINNWLDVTEVCLSLGVLRNLSDQSSENLAGVGGSLCKVASSAMTEDLICCHF